MRRIFLIVLTLIFSSTCFSIFSATAEDSLAEYQYGIKFGDTIEVVTELLPFQGTLSNNVLFVYGAEIDGIENAAASYVFNEKNRLSQISIMYGMVFTTDNVATERNWYKVSSLLTKQHGAPDSDSFHTRMKYETASLSNNIQSVLQDIAAGNISGFPLFEEWMLPHKDDYVKVEHGIVSSTTNGKTSFGHFLNYEVVASEKLTSALYSDAITEYVNSSQNSQTVAADIPTPSVSPHQEIPSDDQAVVYIRNGITLGDTVYNTKSKETLSATPSISTTKGCMKYINCEIDGIVGSNATYYFDQYQTVTSLLVEYKSKYYGTEAKRQALVSYQAISNQLKKQYGSPRATSYQKGHPYLGVALNAAWELIDNYIERRTNGGIAYYEDWLLPHKGNYVKIEHVVYWVNLTASGNPQYYHATGFTLVKGDALTAAASSPMRTAAPTRSARPIYTPKPTPRPLKVSIYSVDIRRNSIGAPTVYVSFMNDGAVSVDRIDFAVECYDAYGQKVKGYDYYDYTTCFFDSKVIKPNQHSSLDYYWTLNGFDGTKSVRIAITKYHCTDGTTYTIPESEWKWHQY